MWLPKHLSQKTLGGCKSVPCISRNNRGSSTARPGCAAAATTSLAWFHKRASRALSASFTYITPPRGTNMIICHRLKANRAEGRKKQLKKSLDVRGLIWSKRSVSTETKRRSSGSLPHFWITIWTLWNPLEGQLYGAPASPNSRGVRADIKVSIQLFNTSPRRRWLVLICLNQG